MSVSDNIIKTFCEAIRSLKNLCNEEDKSALNAYYHLLKGIRHMKSDTFISELYLIKQKYHSEMNSRYNQQNDCDNYMENVILPLQAIRPINLQNLHNIYLRKSGILNLVRVGLS
jgi:hypothetical protein